MAPHVVEKNIRSSRQYHLKTIAKKTRPSKASKKINRRSVANEPIVRVGETIHNDYGSSFEVEDKLGKGAFGEVFKVRQQETGSSLAMKVVCAKTERQVEQVLAEFHIIKHIFGHDVSEFILKAEDSFTYYKNGQSAFCCLFDLLDRPVSDILDENPKKPFHPAVVKTVGFQILSALECLHSIGITHCDIKPDNVMFVIGSPLRVKLIDFGLAYFTTELPQGRRMQNIMYRAPEVLFDLPLTEKMDIWSYAVMMTEMYTGMYLFPADYEAELARYIEAFVGLPKEVKNGSVSCNFLIYDVDKEQQTVMTYAETQSEGLNDIKIDQRIIKSLENVPNFGYNRVARDEVRQDDEEFLQILKKMLKPSAGDRVGAKEALQSSFFGSFDQTSTQGTAHFGFLKEKLRPRSL